MKFLLILLSTLTAFAYSPEILNPKIEIEKDVTGHSCSKEVDSAFISFYHYSCDERMFEVKIINKSSRNYDDINNVWEVELLDKSDGDCRALPIKREYKVFISKVNSIVKAKLEIKINNPVLIELSK